MEVEWLLALCERQKLIFDTFSEPVEKAKDKQGVSWQRVEPPVLQLIPICSCNFWPPAGWHNSTLLTG